NASLKKLKFHLAQFDSVVKKRITPDAHTKEFFKNNDLKARLQDKVTTICKLKDIIKSMRQKSKEENVNNDYGEIVIKNVELENSVAKLLSKSGRLCNEINHVKQVFKEKFDSIKKTRIRSKEQRKDIVDIATQIPSATIIVLGMFKLDLEPLAPRLLQNREAHIDYLMYTQEQADILRGIVEQAKAKQPLDSALDFALQKRLMSHPKTRSRKLGLKCSTIEAQPRKVNKKNRVVEPICDDNVKYSKLNANSDLNCSTCKKSLFDDVHNKCLLDFVKILNSCAKSAKKHKKTKYLETYRITSANVVPPKQATFHSVETQKPELKVYSRKPKNVENIGSSKKAKIVESKTANHSEPNPTWGFNATYIPSSSFLVMTVRFGNDHIIRIMGYGDYQLGNVTISRVYYVEGLGHNLFYVGQFCYGDFEFAFQRNTCFICNLEGVDLLSGSREINLYIISLDDMLRTSLIYLLSKASKTKSWLWHRRLSHLNFGKSKKSSHQPKAEDTNQEKLYLLHMDLCGSMRMASINGKRYILVIVDDYSRFTWVGFFRTKDEAPEAIFKCIKNIQVCLNATVCNVRTDNGTEFVNQTLRQFYENVGISHQTSIARTPQQNDDKKPDLSFFHFFGALCYPTNDNDDLGKLDAKADIAMASEQFSSGVGLQCMTPATSSSGHVPNPVSQQPYVVAPRAVVLADSPVSTSIDQDAPSTSIP
ncbi:retrovirus-related pol polyprotein from transposon TNT 1-94, partial [Tanacetum coccineum]